MDVVTVGNPYEIACTTLPFIPAPNRSGETKTRALFEQRPRVRNVTRHGHVLPGKSFDARRRIRTGKDQAQIRNMLPDLSA